MNYQPTDLLYAHDFDIYNAEAKVQEVNNVDDGRSRVVLNRTPFYPRGGGQDWDTGEIRSHDGLLTVDEVRLDEHGLVHHYGQLDGEMKPGSRVKCQVDTERRQLNTVYHSGGHLIDMAIDQLRYGWVPGKGSHYPDKAYIEYDGDWDAERKEEYLAQLNNEVEKIISAGGINEIRYMSKEEMYKYCRHVPDYLPANKPGRIVIYPGNFGVPCGGTHIKTPSEARGIIVTKIKRKSGVIRVSYDLQS